MVSAMRVPNNRAASANGHWLIRSVSRLGSIDHTIYSFSCKFRRQLGTVSFDMLPATG
jgi:hypothetical protein